LFKTFLSYLTKFFDYFKLVPINVAHIRPEGVFACIGCSALYSQNHQKRPR